MRLVSETFRDVWKPNIEVSEFPDGEAYIRVPEKADDEDEITLFHRCYPNINKRLIETILIAKRFSKNHHIKAVIPYLPYSRQDKEWKRGELKNAFLLIEALGECGVSEIITFDCHFMKGKEYAKIGKAEVKNIVLADELLAEAEKRFGRIDVVASPDEGASYMVRDKNKVMKKRRGRYSEKGPKFRKIERLTFDFDVSGKRVLILDDMIASGGTMAKAAENLKSGGAERVYCCATHGLFLNRAIEKIEESCDGLFCSDTIANEKSVRMIKRKIEGLGL